MAGRYRLTNDTIFTHATRSLARAEHRDIVAGVITSARSRSFATLAYNVPLLSRRERSERDRLP